MVTERDAANYSNKTPPGDYLMHSRVFNDETTIDNYIYMIQNLDHIMSKDDTVIDGRDLPEVQQMNVGTLPNFKAYRRTIIHLHLPPNKCTIFVVIPSNTKQRVNITIDGYFIGRLGPSELHSFISKLNTALNTCFGNSCKITWRRRLDVRKPFVTSNVFLSYLITHHLLSKGNYLQLFMERAMIFKIKIAHEFLEYHDSWFGQLSLPPTHPFIAHGWEGEDDLSGLAEMGWCIIDVEGDGNCGFYSLMLGLEDVGIDNFTVDTDTWARNAHRTTMKKNTDWPKAVVRFRRFLKQHSQYLLTNVYPPEERDLSDEMWLIAGVVEMRDIDGDTVGLTQQFLRVSFLQHQYFADSFRKESSYHMNPFWAPHVLASFKNIRIIVYMQDKSGQKVVWSVTTFDGTGGSVVISQGGIIEDLDQLYQKRLPDIEFKRVPTIEIFFHFHGFDNNSTKHFQFLRRVLCNNTPGTTSPTDMSESTLLEVMFTLNHRKDTLVQYKVTDGYFQ